MYLQLLPEIGSADSFNRADGVYGSGAVKALET